MSYTQQPHPPPGNDLDVNSTDRMDKETFADDDSIASKETDPLADDNYLHSDYLHSASRRVDLESVPYTHNKTNIVPPLEGSLACAVAQTKLSSFC